MSKTWPMVALKRIASGEETLFTDGDWIETPYITDSGVRLIQTGNVGVGFYKEQGFRYVSEETFEQLRCTEVLPGDLLVCRLAEPVGRACLAPNLGVRMITSVDNCIVRPNAAQWSVRYLNYALSGTDYLQQLESMCRGGTRDRVSRSMLGDVQLRRPSKDVQERIANFLDEQTTRIDALIAEKEKLVGALKDIEEVTGFDLVTRGLTAVQKRVSYSEPWLAEVPGHWQLSKLRHVARIGNGSTPKRDKDEYWTGGDIPWLNSGSVNSPRICEASDFVTETARRECHLPMVRAGSTVVALTGQGKTRGTAAFTELETTINQHLAYISPVDGRLTDEFLWVALTGFYSVLRHLSEGEGSTKGALTCEQLNQFRLPLPPLEEQLRIVQAYKARTQAIEELLDHAREHIERLREYRSSLISAAVTGQLDVGAPPLRRHVWRP